MSKMIDGKKPMGTKQVMLTDDSVFGESSGLPPDVKADMDEKGWIPRWLNAKVVYSNQGYHPKGWNVYKRDKHVPGAFKFGNDPDGVIRKGDLILGYKTAEKHAQHKALNEQKAERQYRAANLEGQKLKEYARSRGLDTHIDDKYDDE